MRVGIYNRWLATLGGGEKYDLTIAEHLSRKHHVEVISHTQIDKQFAADRLNVDLSQVDFIVLPDRTAHDMAPITSQYDFFINGSYLDFFPCYAPKSSIVVFFPFPLGGTSLIRRMAKNWLRKIFDLPQVMISPQTFLLSRGGSGWITDTDFKMHVPALKSPYTLECELDYRDTSLSGVTVYQNGKQIRELSKEKLKKRYLLNMTIPQKDQRSYHEVVISLDSNKVAWDGLPRLAINNLRLDTNFYRTYTRWFRNILNRAGIYLEYAPPGSSVMQYLDTYDAIWTISKFTQAWTWRYWQRPSEILYPPVNVESFQVGKKTPKILNVGRFFAGQHNKKHHVMLDAFKQMVNQGLKGWELHLVGGSTPGEEHHDYLESLSNQAQGYPVVIHPDMPFPELKELYATCTIYWHASGFGEDEQREPVKSEHFGISTVESMAAGCVPVVINKGGQPEIVQQGLNGFLWNTIRELKEFTLQIINDDNLRAKLSFAAVESSSNYDSTSFNSRLTQLFYNEGQE